MTDPVAQGVSMAFNSTTGKWDVEDDGVASRIAAITSGNSDMMKQAATSGTQAANRRGLGNSSMAVGAAQSEVIRAAAPIASQEAQQAYGKNQTRIGNDQQTEITMRTIGADERARLASSVTDLSGQRFQAIANTLNNEKIPAGTRSAVEASINDQHTQAMNYLQNLYGVYLPYTTPQPAPAPTGGLGYPG